MRCNFHRYIARVTAVLAALLVCVPSSAHASISLLLEEPFGTFGSLNPTGHAAIYLSNVCAETPTRLRLCRPGEMGAVISRYHRVHGLDWVAMPLIPYLYAVEDQSDIPESATPALRAQLRDTYRRAHLLDIAPTPPSGATPGGEWIQLLGSAYDRRIFGFQLSTTREQDERIIARLNDGHNRGRFNLLFRNCADFSRSVLRTAYPDSIPRNAIADFGLTTPKHLARSVTRFGTEQQDVAFSTFQIPQVPGTIPRSRKVDGIAESLVRSKKYFVPLVFVSPTTAASLVAAYVGTGRFRVPANAPEMPELGAVQPTLVLDTDTISLPADIAGSAQKLACTESTGAAQDTEGMLSGAGSD